MKISLFLRKVEEPLVKRRGLLKFGGEVWKMWDGITKFALKISRLGIIFHSGNFAATPGKRCF